MPPWVLLIFAVLMYGGGILIGFRELHKLNARVSNLESQADQDELPTPSQMSVSGNGGSAVDGPDESSTARPQ